MPRAEHAIDSSRTDTLDVDPSSTSPYLPAQAPQRRAAHAIGDDVCTCRCSPAASGVAVVGIFALITTCTVAVQRMSGSSRPPPPPPWVDLPSVAQCGTWPDYIPCYQCLYGADPAKRYRVQPGDKCAELSRKLGAPRFDLFIRNRSLSCCDTDPMPGEWIDVCDPPTRDQWKADGHPRAPPETGVIGSFLGSASNGYVGLPPGENISTSINVVMLFPTNDIDSKGNFVVDSKFASECDTLIDPVSPRRQMLLDSPWRNGKVLTDQRVWQFSLGTNAGRWSGISADEWGQKGAAALEKIILRYRLDGIDVNIESPRAGFVNNMCSLFRHLKEIDSELVITVTPYSHTLGSYNQIGSQCGDLVTWVNYQSYSDLQFGTSVITKTYQNIAKAFGKGGAADWSKVAWGASTQIGKSRPKPSEGHTLMSTLQQMHPDARGVFVWTAEYSSRSKPPWCFEDQMAQVMRGEQPHGSCAHTK